MADVVIEAEVGKSRKGPFWAKATLQGCHLQSIRKNNYRKNERDFEYSITGQASVPSRTILTFWTEGGDGGDGFADFWILQVNSDIREQKVSSGSHYYLKGRIEILAYGSGDTDALRLRKWWEEWSVSQGGQTDLTARWLGKYIRKGYSTPPSPPKAGFIDNLIHAPVTLFKPVDGWIFDDVKAEVRQEVKADTTKNLTIERIEPYTKHHEVGWLELFWEWRHDGLEELSYIKQYSELLLTGGFGELSKEQCKAVKVISKVCSREIRNWYHRTIYTEIRYSPEKITWEAIDLSKCVKDVEDSLRQECGVDSIEVVVPDDLPYVKSNRYLTVAIFNLISPARYIDSYLKDYPPTINVSLGEEDTVIVMVHNGQRSISPSGFEIDLAKLIIEQHGSPVEVNYSADKGIDYQFTLSVWHS
jgi:hypothetical protein